jgi:hypothetical protein
LVVFYAILMPVLANDQRLFGVNRLALLKAPQYLGCHVCASFTVKPETIHCRFSGAQTDCGCEILYSGGL